MWGSVDPRKQPSNTVKSSSAIVLAALFGIASCLPAEAAPASKRAKKPTARAATTGAAQQPAPTGPEYLTGSNLKRPVKRADTISKGPNPVAYYDRSAIARSGAGDLTQFLGKVPTSR